MINRQGPSPNIILNTMYIDVKIAKTFCAGCAQSKEHAGAVHHGAEHGLDRHHPRGGGGPRVRDALT